MAAGHRAAVGKRSRFFVVFIGATVVLVLAGFGRTFLAPLSRGTFSAPWFVYAHASLFFAWMGVLVAQAVLALRRLLPWHRRLGWVGAALIVPMAASGVVVAHWATRRDFAAGQGDAALAFFFGQLMDMLLFATLATAAVALRRVPAAHKRMVVLATLAILGAAVGRIPMLDGVADGVTLGLLLCLSVFDLATLRRLHRATLSGGAWLLLGTHMQAPLGSTATWLAWARHLVEGGG